MKKKNLFNRVGALLLTLTMAVSMMSFGVSAANEATAKRTYTPSEMEERRHIAKILVLFPSKSVFRFTVSLRYNDFIIRILMTDLDER